MVCGETRAGLRVPFMGALAQADDNWCWTHQHETAPPAVGLMADASLERNLELPGDVRGSPGTGCSVGSD